MWCTILCQAILLIPFGHSLEIISKDQEWFNPDDASGKGSNLTLKNSHRRVQDSELLSKEQCITEVTNFTMNSEDPDMVTIFIVTEYINLTFNGNYSNFNALPIRMQLVFLQHAGMDGVFELNELLEGSNGLVLEEFCSDLVALYDDGGALAPSSSPTLASPTIYTLSPTSFNQTPSPTSSKTEAPTNTPPSRSPLAQGTNAPISTTPTNQLSPSPTPKPSFYPSMRITFPPTKLASSSPSNDPTVLPTLKPSISLVPTETKPSFSPSTCVDLEGWTDRFGDGCNWYSEDSSRCEFLGGCCADEEGITANIACCGCQALLVDDYFDDHKTTIAPTYIPSQESINSTISPTRDILFANDDNTSDNDDDDSISTLELVLAISSGVVSTSLLLYILFTRKSARKSMIIVEKDDDDDNFSIKRNDTLNPTYTHSPKQEKMSVSIQNRDSDKTYKFPSRTKGLVLDDNDIVDLDEGKYDTNIDNEVYDFSGSYDNNSKSSIQRNLEEAIDTGDWHAVHKLANQFTSSSDAQTSSSYSKYYNNNSSDQQLNSSSYNKYYNSNSSDQQLNSSPTDDQLRLLLREAGPSRDEELLEATDAIEDLTAEEKELVRETLLAARDKRLREEQYRNNFVHLRSPEVPLYSKPQDTKSITSNTSNRNILYATRKLNYSNASLQSSQNLTTNQSIIPIMAYTEISGKKLQRKLGAQLNESAAVQISKDSFAQKMMRRMGWQEGQGLGKDQQGMKEHIKVKQRLEEEGIGHDKFQMEKAIAGDCWWQQSMGDTLARLQKQKRKILDETKEKTKKKPKKRKIDEESDDENGDERKLKKRKKEKKKKKEKVKTFYTDEELFEATGGARFGMRAQRRQHGKWARAESGISAEEEAIAKNAMEWDGTGKAQFASSSLNELNTKTSTTTYDTEKVIASSVHEVSTSSENSEPNDNTGRDDRVIKEEKVEMKTKKVKKNKSDKKGKKNKKSKKCAR